MAGSEADPASISTAIFGYLFRRGQFIINTKGLRDLQRHYPRLWEKIVKFRADHIVGIIAVLIKMSKRKPIKEINPKIVSAVIIAAVDTVLTLDFILENGLTFEDAAEQLRGLFMNIFANDWNRPD